MTISFSYRVVSLPALVVGTGHSVCDRHHRFVDFEATWPPGTAPVDHKAVRHGRGEVT
jgi:hypothetical protein